MKCPKCNGYGIVGDAVPDILRGRGHIFSSNECDRCHGSGEVEMTNEEWLRTATTEQLAEWLVQFVDFCAAGCSHCAIEKICMDKKYKDLSPEQMVEVWLKQPHREE